MSRSLLLSLPFLVGGMCHAAEVPPAMADYISGDLSTWINAPRIVAAIQEQNMRHEGLSAADIDEMDTAWRAQVGTSETPIIAPVMGHPLSDFLREQVTQAKGRITEVFVMDNRGLNVATSDVTSDYWQGDEAKFQKTFGAGAGAVFVDDVELDESTQTYQGQVSFSITDPDSGAVIGAITVGLDASAFY
ncbi:hypothetical protein FIU94_14165 [Sulfitobacter sp. THAF37]|uniref:hypothetical protein n=1 Tax=Sulfitobacter sp. THAF37 TaxID=2587855 RepID=UPI001268A5BB|nr:hypothetical protein [Sulfitobacter sp. THAF37]QFT59973.1 hypothetical protein FIU94_14165 [Sulfitobacter sp. THAF37]